MNAGFVQQAENLRILSLAVPSAKHGYRIRDVFFLRGVNDESDRQRRHSGLPAISLQCSAEGRLVFDNRDGGCIVSRVV